MHKFLRFGFIKIFLNNVFYSFLSLRSISQYAFLKSVSIDKIRNVGIIAHIDAGKTTTTERILYYSGTISTIGEVDDGSTVTDFLEAERERGITITSSIVSFRHNQYHCNLIDTPGHIDFNYEVEKSLSVLDSSLLIMDGSVGVETQTLTVWYQAQKYCIPCLAFLNKMDKANASLNSSIKSIKNKLKLSPLFLNFPIYLKNNKLIGLYDVVDLKAYIWNPNSEHEHCVLSDENISKIANINYNDFKKEIKEYRNCLVEELAQVDDSFASLYIECEDSTSIPSSNIKEVLKSILSSKNTSYLPILCGSSKKNIGVRLLLDAINSYLPSPLSRKGTLKDPSALMNLNSDKLLAFIFKVIFHPSSLSQKSPSPIHFIRVYYGILKPGVMFFNVNKSISECCSKICYAFADEYISILSASSGDIVAVHGLKLSHSGDTIVEDSEKYAYKNEIAGEKSPSNKTMSKCVHILPQPKPVFFVSLEAESPKSEQKLQSTLEYLQLEDPSLSFAHNEQTQQLILSGIGELQIEVLRDRLLKEFKLKTYLGPISIAYREVPSFSCFHEVTLNQNFHGKKYKVTIKLELIKLDDANQECEEVNINYSKGTQLHAIHRDQLKALNLGLENVCNYGPLLGGKVSGFNLNLHAFLLEGNKGISALPFITYTMTQCLVQALMKCQLKLYGPIMFLDITLLDTSYSSDIISDLTSRGAEIISNIYANDNSFCSIKAKACLSKLLGFSSRIRRLSSGNSHHTMTFLEYGEISNEEQLVLLQK